MIQVFMIYTLEKSLENNSVKKVATHKNDRF